jgi:hypothetical protein
VEGLVDCQVNGVVVRFEPRVASLAVITKLVELGYLQPGARHRATAVERAIDRLRSDLIRQGVQDGRKLGDRIDYIVSPRA